MRNLPGFERPTSADPSPRGTMSKAGTMKPTVVGMAVGAVLAFTALLFDFWGFLLMALFIAVGAFFGRAAEGKVDFRSVRDALTGRRSSS